MRANNIYIDRMNYKYKVATINRKIMMNNPRVAMAIEQLLESLNMGTHYKTTLK
jgi:hypothetical protein